MTKQYEPNGEHQPRSNAMLGVHHEEEPASEPVGLSGQKIAGLIVCVLAIALLVAWRFA